MHLQFIAENRPVYFIQDILMKRRRNNKEKYPRSGSDKYNNPKDYMGTRKKTHSFKYSEVINREIIVVYYKLIQIQCTV